VNPEIFKAYDVRGTYPDQMDEEVAYRVGNAFARVIAEGEGTSASELTLGLGRDMRLSAPSMAARYADGMRDAGATVLDVGMVGTEML
jgi:phosphomannomutase